MNNKLQRLVDWARNNSVDLDKADIDGNYNSVSFWQHREDRINFQAVKRATGSFDKKGDPPYVKLMKKIKVDYVESGAPLTDEWEIRWEGAYECKSLGYECGPAVFKDEETDPADEEQLTPF